MHHQPSSRRTFLKAAAATVGLSPLGLPVGETDASIRDALPRRPRSIEVRRVNSAIEKEPLVRPYGFKGSAHTVGCQVVSLMESASGARGIGLGKQSVLWSDAKVFAKHGEEAGNALMYALTVYALELARGTRFSDPLELLDAILPETYQYAQRITGIQELRETFVLNALVSLDNAAWLLYAAENGLDTFDAMIPEPYRSTLSARNDRVIALPSASYQTPIQELITLVEQGFFYIKIKIGNPGSQSEMLQKDQAQLTAIHEAVGDTSTPHGLNGKLTYVLDPNGRYQHIDTLRRFLDHADKIGALQQVALIEEPFPEDYRADVHDLPVRIASDESTQTPADVAHRHDLGYGAIVVKPIAKTLSRTLRITKAAYDRGMPCFCADLTANPILVDWNKSFAARLPAFPGLGHQLIETNGFQNYAEWDKLVSYHPCPDGSWVRPKNGMYVLSEAFYDRSACLFDPSAHYAGLVTEP